MEESIRDEKVQSSLKQTSKEDRPICGFWQRILALIIDSIILGVIGMALGFFLGDYFARIGAWGRLIGFVIAISYFEACTVFLRLCIALPAAVNTATA